MSYALVGSAGTFVQGSSGTLSPAFGQTTTANHLLICWLATQQATNPSTPPTGWSLGESGQTGAGAAIYYKIAAGGDAAPTFTVTTNTIVELAEFSGNATSSPVDQVGFSGSANATNTVTSAAADALTGELIIGVSTALYSTSTTRTVTSALGTVSATNTPGTNSGVSTALFFNFVWGITTSNAAADTNACTVSTTSKLTENGGILASFKLAPAAFIAPRPTILDQAVNRLGTY